ncbi:DMT family transporter [Thermophilibacter provencensis]|uniref:DMT family transporter n=1 Tax=Thermophilibacter provencensis TaxID=1852386 RepID=A0ABT7V3D7_9ACTN|nr:DMT family transporter [Thermophilibacter provencensis]MDM8271113.1 DMT family transporter [Thermophilibacter provencensis]
MTIEKDIADNTARPGRRVVPQWAWKLSLAVCAAIWGGSFVVMKDTLDVIPPAWLMGIRFAASTVIVGALFWRRLRDNLDLSHLAMGAILGLASGAAFVVQNVGLDDTTPGRNAFLTATYCVMTPFINWFVTRRRPDAGNLVAALLAIVGVGLVALGDDLSLIMSGGDWLTLVAAVLFAVHIVLVARFSSAHDVMTLTVVQLGVSALVALGTAVVMGPPPAPSAFASADVWFSLAYLVLLSSCVCMVVQNLGQAHVPPAQASLLLSLESVFAVVSSVIFYNELVTPRIAVGFGTIFVAVLVSEFGLGRKRASSGRSGAKERP